METISRERNERGWLDLETLVHYWASDRQHFSSLVTALCATEYEED